MNHLSILLLGFIGLMLIAPDRKAPTYEFEDALNKGLIQLSEVEYVGDGSLRLKIKNLNKKKDIQIQINTGLQFASIDTSEQDQVVLAERTLLVKADSHRSATLTSYCTQADHLSPGSGSKFALKAHADGKLLQLAQFLSQIRDIDYTAQQAVWVITNDHDLRGLHHQDPEKAVEIQNFVADLTGKSRPVYTVRYRDSGEGQRAFTRESISIHGAHEYDNEAEGLFTCKIFSEAGDEVKEVFKDMRQGRGHVRFSFHLETTRLPKGKYVSRVFKDGEVMQEIWVES